MTQMIRIDQPSPPPEPGRVLRQKLLTEMQLTQAQVANAIGVSRPRFNMMLKDRCHVTPEIALRIERVFGIPPHFWLRLRAEFELFRERQQMIPELEKLPQLRARAASASRWHVGEWRVAA